MGARRYTEREQRFIKDHYNFMTDEELSSKMNRSAAAIKEFRKRIGLYKDTEGFDRFKNLHAKIALSKEIFALKYYISLGKGGKIAKDRLQQLEPKQIQTKKFKVSRRKTPLAILAEIYEMSVLGISMSNIGKELGYSHSSVKQFVYSIKGVKSGLTITLPSKV